MEFGKVISGKNVYFSLIEEDDAQMIIDLRSKYGNFMSSSSDKLEDQISWIREYKKRNKDGLEYYFSIKNNQDNKIGVIRIYNIDRKNSECTFGSWIIEKNNPLTYSLESLYLNFKFIFKDLSMKRALFDVRKQNKSILNFYINVVKAKMYKEDDLDKFFYVDEEIYENYKDFLLKKDIIAD